MKRILLFVLTLCATNTIIAQTFNFNGINYKVTSPTTVEVAVNYGLTGAVVIPSTVTNSSLTYSVNRIGNDAFDNFYNSNDLTSIIIPNSVTSIGQSAFYNCTGLTSINIPNSVNYISSWAFRACKGLTSVIIPSLVKTISQGTFYDCSGLISVSIPNSVTSIENVAFSACIKLTSLDIPSSVTSIEGETFNYCKSLKSVNIPNSITSIQYALFSSCSNLTSVTIPNSISSISDQSFAGCISLTSVTVNLTTPININTNVFGTPAPDPSSLGSVPIASATLYVPFGTLAAYQAAPVWQDFGTIIEMQPITFTNNGINYKTTSATTIEISANPNFTGVLTIPSSITYEGITYDVTSIANSAFAGCSGLISVTIPNTVISIGDYAFTNCTGLTAVTVNWVNPIIINPNVFGDVPITIGYAPSKILSTYKTKPVVLANTKLSSATLYVPIGTLETYKTAPVWQNFGTILEQNPLPLTLTSFTAKAISTGNQINWATANVVNVKNIMLERSGADNNFSHLATLSVTTSEYIDHNPLAGDNYYRLSTIDNDGGTKTYPQIAFVKGFSNEMSFYPNPVSNGVLNIVPGGNKLQSVALFDLNGKKVVFVNTINSTEKVLVNTQGLVKGVYLLEINSEKTKVVKKVVVN